MADLLTIVYNTGDENAPLAAFLDAQIKQSGKYVSIVKTKAEYESANFEGELLGTSSDELVIFIGQANTDLAGTIKWIYDEYGMKYGWIGKQAVLLVEKKKWNKDELAELVKFLGQEQETKPKNGIKEQLDKISGKVNKLPLGLKVAGAVAGGAFFGVAGAAVAGSAFLINNKLNSDKLFESQQKYLVNKFITMSISQFTGRE
jgi:hypothetical protein